MRYLGAKTPLLGLTPFTCTQTMTWSLHQVHRPTYIQVKSSHSVSADPESPLDPSGPHEVSTEPLQESVPYPKHDITSSVETGDMQARVSCEEASAEDRPDMSLQSSDDFIKEPYVIHNLASHGPLYIPKGTVITYTDDEEPEMDCFEIAKSYEEAQEMMQYRNHLPKHPLLLVPSKSDFICSHH